MQQHFLEAMFHPRSLAIVGASPNDPETGWMGRLINFGFGDVGEIYPVNPKADQVHGLKAYPTVRDIPGPVDYVIFNIPARVAPQVMTDCAAKGVKFAHVFAAGFSEIGTPEAAALERRLRDEARKAGIRVLGPNCMGIYCPEGKLTFNSDFSKEAGNIAFVSQSGAESMRLVFLGQDVGLRFSKVISYGNAIDLDAPDFLEYLQQDEKTRVIAMYVEGVKQGPRFFNAVKRCLESGKPVVILKAGLTESGAGAAVSHTASLAGAKAIWDAFFRQTGACQANTMDEVADILQALVRMKPPRGRRVAVVGRGGGIGVVAADICERAGLKVPAFARETRDRLTALIPEAGAGVRNPVETTYGMGGAADFYRRGLPVVDADPNTDVILIQLAIDVYGSRTPNLARATAEAAASLCEEAPSIHKPIAVGLFSGGHPDVVAAVTAARDKLTASGIPVFSGVESASRAISKMASFYEARARR